MEKYTALRLWAVYFFVSLGGALGRAGAESIPRQCAEGGHAKKCMRRGLWRAVSGGQLFKNRTFLHLRGRDRAPCAETGCFRESQNELRCKNNGIRGETARRARKRGVFGIHKTNHVVKTTEFAERPRGGRGVLIFRSTAGKMGQAAACWRAKSADGGGNRRTSAKKNTRGRCAVFPGGMQMGNARKGTRPPVQRRGRR